MEFLVLFFRMASLFFGAVSTLAFLALYKGSVGFGLTSCFIFLSLSDYELKYVVVGIMLYSLISFLLTIGAVAIGNAIQYVLER